MKTPIRLALALAISSGSALAQQEHPPVPAPPTIPGAPSSPAPPRPEAPESRPGQSHEAQHGAHGDAHHGDHRVKRDHPHPTQNRSGDRGEARRPGDLRRELGRPGAARELLDRARPQVPTPYLGLVTAPVQPALGAQLGLPQGFGLVVEEVVPHSPAQSAGVERYDVLKLLNDQQLIDPNQLATLVRTAGKDAEVTLTLLRKGEEQKVTIRVGEKMLPPRGVPGPRPFAPFGDTLMIPPLRSDAPSSRIQQRGRRDVRGAVPEQAERMQERLREHQERLRNFQERLREWQKNPRGEMPRVPQLENLSGGPDVRQSPFGATAADNAQIEIEPGAAGAIDRVTFNTGYARVKLKDADGEIDVTTKDGRRHLLAKNASGETVFDGSVETEAERASVPQPFREKLERQVHLVSRLNSSTASANPFGASNSGTASAEDDHTDEPEIQ